MHAIRSPVPDKILKTFRENPQWPRGLLPMICIQSVSPGSADQDDPRGTDCNMRKLEARSRTEPLRSSWLDHREACGALHAPLSRHQRTVGNVREDRGYYFNTARTFCHFARFELLMIEMRLTGLTTCPINLAGPRCIRAGYRAPLECSRARRTDRGAELRRAVHAVPGRRKVEPARKHTRSRSFPCSKSGAALRSRTQMPFPSSIKATRFTFRGRLRFAAGSAIAADPGSRSADLRAATIREDRQAADIGGRLLEVDGAAARDRERAPRGEEKA